MPNKPIAANSFNRVIKNLFPCANDRKYTKANTEAVENKMALQLKQ